MMAPQIKVNVTERKDLADHLKQEHSAGYADRLSETELVALHDKDHKSPWPHGHPR